MGERPHSIQPIYPDFLDPLLVALMAEVREIRELGVYLAQIRYTDDDRKLTVFVASNDQTSSAPKWRERDAMINEFGKTGFPKISIKVSKSGQQLP